jgi:hypothetical protein
MASLRILDAAGKARSFAVDFNVLAVLLRIGYAAGLSFVVYRQLRKR